MQNQINDLRNSRSGQDRPPFPSDLTSPHDAVQPVATSALMQKLSTPAVPPGVLEPDVPRFYGHTSSKYGFDIANSTLESMGITQESMENGNVPETRSMYTPINPSSALYLSRDPLWVVNETEAVRLCKVYDEEIGIMYPHIDIDKVIKNVSTVFSCMSISISLQTGSGQLTFHGADALGDDDIMIVKMVIAIGLLLEGSGISDLSQRLFYSVKDAINSKILCARNIKSVTLFILTVSVLGSVPLLFLIVGFSQRIIFRRTKKHRHGVASVLQPVCASRWVSIARTL